MKIIRLCLTVLFFLVALNTYAGEQPVSLLLAQAKPPNDPSPTPPMAVDPRRQMQHQYQQRQPQVENSKEEKPSYTMRCPPHNLIELDLSFGSDNWTVSPATVKPETFERAYGQVDKQNKNRVTLACLYRIDTTIAAMHPLDGSQKCPAKGPENKTIINFVPLGVEGYSADQFGKSAPGKLQVANIGRRVDKANKQLVCKYKAKGVAQIFKKHTTDIQLSSCRGNSLNVKCQ